jgi:ATP-binding cassette subfamily C (CFTR/MRP) protein 1
VVAVERINEYSRLDAEASDANPSELPAAWPAHGRIEFHHVFARYRPELEDVLRGVDFVVPAGSKVGVCGRTGSGKSSLFLVLLRIIETSQGAVVVDGMDIRRVGLQQLRSNVSVVPQDAVLFVAPLRDNLDPSRRCSDAEIWRVLDICSLHEHVTLLGGLDALVSEAGSNFSFGQRQLICIARAVLRKTSILLCDEASSGIDLATDEKVQAAIRSEFQTCTTVTIAHRLETILQSDLVIVMDQGVVAEFDSPQTLGQLKGGLFAGLVQEMKGG